MFPYGTYRIHTLGKSQPRELLLIAHVSLWMAKLIIPNLKWINNV
jgi:hypothetical protein